MEKKNTAQMKALLQLKQMVQDLIEEDFKSNKMPKLAAVKVEVKKPVEMEVDTPDLTDMVTKTAEEVSAPEVCEECGEEDCGCEVKAPVVKESESVIKLKKLLGK